MAVFFFLLQVALLSVDVIVSLRNMAAAGPPPTCTYSLFVYCDWICETTPLLIDCIRRELENFQALLLLHSGIDGRYID